MKRRNLLLGSAAFAAAPSFEVARQTARAAQVADPNRLNGDLTPLGAERAASKSGLVPAWTGGVGAAPDATPAGAPPDPFSGQPPLFTVTAENMSQYAAMLSDGQMQMLKRFGGAGYKIVVYPSERTACAPQAVYDETSKNATRAQAVPGGIVQGFTNAVGGIPFPILSDDPAEAGAQAMWNHELRWAGRFSYLVGSFFVVGNGQRVLTGQFKFWTYNRFYDPAMTPENFSGFYSTYYIENIGPPNLLGQKFMASYSTRPLETPNIAFTYLVGEGRIREAPSAQYDTPNTQSDDAINYDESFLFVGSLDRYNWRLVEKKEMIVPYNQYDVFSKQPNDVMGLEFVNPDLIRNEVHRCWVVEAHLAPGKRMTDPVRRFYLDEDTWTILLSDLYDDQGNYWRFGSTYMQTHPAMPGNWVVGTNIYNLQKDEYQFNPLFYNAPPPLAGSVNFDPLPTSMFDPQSMVDSGGL